MVDYRGAEGGVVDGFAGGCGEQQDDVAVVVAAEGFVGEAACAGGFGGGVVESAGAEVVFETDAVAAEGQ